MKLVDRAQTGRAPRERRRPSAESEREQSAGSRPLSDGSLNKRPQQIAWSLPGAFSADLCAPDTAVCHWSECFLLVFVRARY